MCSPVQNLQETRQEGVSARRGSQAAIPFRRISRRRATSLYMLFLLSAGNAFTGAGSLDTAFDTDGVAVAIQGDGKIVAVGRPGSVVGHRGFP